MQDSEQEADKPKSNGWLVNNADYSTGIYAKGSNYGDRLICIVRDNALFAMYGDAQLLKKKIITFRRLEMEVTTYKQKIPRNKYGSPDGWCVACRAEQDQLDPHRHRLFD